MAKELPNNLEAEKSVLGSMFLSQYAQQKALETLYPENFYFEKNAKVFSAIKELVNESSPIDITTVSTKLKNKKELKTIGDIEYLTELVECVPTAANVDYYIKIVEENSVLRNLIEEATGIATLGYEHEGSVNETLDKAESKILNVIKKRKSSELKPIADVLAQSQEILEKLASNKGDVTGIATGWTDFDKVTAGLQGKQLIILAARTGMGKTAFALNLATNVAIKEKKTVAIFTLEMGAEQLANRMISAVGQIDGNKLKTGKLYSEDWKRVNEAMSQLGETNIFIDDSPGITVGDIRAKCRRLASSEAGLGIVIIDYMQLIQGGARYAGNRQQEVAEISRSLKTMAIELDVPVIALSQLSRPVDLRADKRPILPDLRESGSIEQDADIVAFLYMEDYYDKEKKRPDGGAPCELIIAKHRNGITTTVDLYFKRNTSSFVNYKKTPTGEENE
ncbi:MAG TPA: replicative DNA helicase [Bacilli bacterium]|nr:replicative DNA helicase [Bacilli bacterium]